MKALTLSEVKKLKVVGKAYPKKEVLLQSCFSYFDCYRTEESKVKGTWEFTKEALNKVTDVAMFNALGITRKQWETWKNSKDIGTKGTRDAIEKIEQILEQIDQERLVTRGNSGDIFRMKVKYKWNEHLAKDKKAIKELSTDRVASIIKRMSDG